MTDSAPQDDPFASRPKPAATLVDAVASPEAAAARGRWRLPESFSLKQFAMLMVCSGSVAAWFSFGLPTWIDVTPWLVQSLYHVLWAQLGCTLFALWSCGRAARESLDWPRLLRRGALPLALGLALAGAFTLAIERDFRVLADETNLVGSSLSLYLNRTYENITEGYFYYDSFHPTASGLDKRPALFPFLMAILHLLLGYDAYHGYLVNFLAAVGLGATVFAVGRRYGDARLGACWVLGLVSIPIYGLGVVSSGFEALNLLLVTLVVWQCVEFLQRPTASRLELLAYLTLAAAQCRYESVVLVAPVALVTLARLRRLRFERGALRLLLVPLFFVPLNWQKQVTSAINAGDAEDTVIFALDHALRHLPTVAEFWFDPEGKGYPSVPLLAALATLGLVLLLWRASRPGAGSLLRWAMALAGGSALTILLIQTSYYMGDFRGVAAHRIAISLASLISLLAVYPLWILVRQRVLYPVGVMALAFLVVTSLGTAGRNEQGRWLLLFREYKAGLRFLLSQPREGTLLIADRPGLYTVHQYGAISFATANDKVQELIDGMNRRLYTNVLVEQQVFYAAPHEPKPELTDRLRTEPVLEYQNDSQYFIRISRVLPAESKPGVPNGKRRHRRAPHGRAPEPPSEP